MGKKSHASRKKSGRGKRGASQKPAQSAQKGRLLEEIAARMHAAPRVKVERNVKLPGLHRDANYPGEIDVLLSSAVASYPVRLAIECKNLKGKVGKEKIESFLGKLEDVGIPHQHGIYISAKGYTRDALDRARSTGLRLLTLTGLAPDGLASEQTEATQFCVFYLAQVGGISVTNNVETMVKGGELLTFFDERGKFCGTVTDLIWNKWREGQPRPEAGEHELDLAVPVGWHQIVNGKIEPVLGISVTIQVWAQVLTIPGKSEHHALINAKDQIVERTQINMSFDVPRKGKIVHTLHAFATEAELQSFLGKAEGSSLTVRRSLPRIQYMNVCFYPLSRRVAEKIKEHTKDFVAGKMSAPPPQLNAADLEGTDLSAMWEPLCEGYPGKVVPVLVTTDEDEVVDVTALIREKQFGRVTEMRQYYERNLRPELGELICSAYLLQGMSILSKAKKKSESEASRLSELALEKARSALQINPNMAEAHHDLGVMLQSLGHYEEAIACFGRALILDPDQPHAWVSRAESQAKLRRYEDSLASYDRALSLDPDDADAIYHRSAILMALERFEESVAGYDQVLKAEPGDYESWYYRGVALNKLSRFAEAADSFDRVIDLERGHAAAWGQRGFALHNLGRIEDAEASYRVALELDSDMHQVALLRGFALANLGRYEESAIYFDQGLANEPGDYEAWNTRATVLERLDRNEEALESYERALEFDPVNRQTLLSRGMVLHKLDRLEEAVASFGRAIEADPQRPEAWHARGLALYLLGRDDDALSDYDQVLSITREEYGTWSNRALPLIELDRFDEALRSVNEALQLIPSPIDQTVPLLVRAKVYYRMDRKPDTAYDLVAAWKLDPKLVLSSDEYRSIIAEISAALQSPTPEVSLLFAEVCAEEAAISIDAGDGRRARDNAKSAAEALSQVREVMSSRQAAEDITLSKETVSLPLRFDETMTRIIRRFEECRDEILVRELIEEIGEAVPEGATPST